jgi:hypothetical protein
MLEPTITCPRCETEIKLTESLAAPIVESTRRQYEERIAAREADMRRREADLGERQAAVVRAQESLSAQVEARVRAETERIAVEEARKARQTLGVDLEQRVKEVAELQEVLKARDQKLAAAQKVQAELMRKQRELDDAKREIDLTIEQRVQDAIGKVRGQARREAEDQLRLKVVEREQTITAMQRQIEDLKRRAEQGSQQLQGEAQEIELEAILRVKFPHDAIERIPKGELGGDVLQRVIGPAGQRCGCILWETKRTRNWNDAWLVKLRDDQRAMKADAALIVSQTLPKGVETFELIEGVWVIEPRCAVPLAVAIRHLLIELTAARQSSEGQQSKMDLVYRYLTGPRFRQRVQAIVEKSADMQDDLDKERKAMTRLWAKREEQIHAVIEATAGMYGDLQGIAGRTLQEIEGLEFKMLASDEEAIGNRQ